MLHNYYIITLLLKVFNTMRHNRYHDEEFGKDHYTSRQRAMETFQDKGNERGYVCFWTA